MPARDWVYNPEDQLTEPPSFDLSYAFDDEEAPARVTVYSEREDEIATHWISIDVDYAVDVDVIA